MRQVRNRNIFFSFILVLIILIETGCATSEDPDKRKKRALLGGATSTAIGVATGVGGPILAARAAIGATSRVVTGDVVDKMKEKHEENEENIK